MGFSGSLHHLQIYYTELNPKYTKSVKVDPHLLMLRKLEVDLEA